MDIGYIGFERDTSHPLSPLLPIHLRIELKHEAFWFSGGHRTFSMVCPFPSCPLGRRPEGVARLTTSYRLTVCCLQRGLWPSISIGVKNKKTHDDPAYATFWRLSTFTSDCRSEDWLQGWRRESERQARRKTDGQKSKSAVTPTADVIDPSRFHIWQNAVLGLRLEYLIECLY